MSGLYSSLNISMGKRPNLLCNLSAFKEQRVGENYFLFGYLNDLGHEQIHSGQTAGPLVCSHSH